MKTIKGDCAPGVAKPTRQEVLSGLANARAIFQRRAILTAMGLNPDATQPTPPTAEATEATADE